MDNELYLEEWTIENIRDDEDRLGNPVKSASIGRSAVGTQISLYENDLELLQTILGCNEEQLKGKNITAVNKERITRAIGYQGLYIPLYYRDGSSKILSESELCGLLESFNVIRLNNKGEQITSYEVPAKSVSNKRSM